MTTPVEQRHRVLAVQAYCEHDADPTSSYGLWTREWLTAREHQTALPLMPYYVPRKLDAIAQAIADAEAAARPPAEVIEALQQYRETRDAYLAATTSGRYPPEYLACEAAVNRLIETVNRWLP